MRKIALFNKKEINMTVLETLKDIIKDADATIDVSTVTAESRLIEDLNIDSLTVAMISVELEERYDIEIDVNQKFVTAGDVCGYIEGMISSK